ncbi:MULTISPECIES: TetR/AcrR family transcriptional regulator [Thalassotalea]|uniref:TetR/AcrR family transcriptional regulator n=1 Tax=Thalassotalea TaxID=1518149 RepID=UPI0009423CA5|nr:MULTISPECIES: TetR/AcrR family transcriptional regulator [Thalassotalea]OKY27159.1 TetR family transcriptional regulator [Thalassotalea sp. PP2-459]
MTKTVEKMAYHHGDLYQTLLDNATNMLSKKGIEALSLRKLAEKSGVSRTAAYHHFADKHDLLCAIAAKGFTQWRSIADDIANNKNSKIETQYRNFVYRYLDFATSNPHLYNLMFGHTIWQSNNVSEQLKKAAYPTFSQQVEMVNHWQEQQLLPNEHSSLRMSQVVWGTLHGIAKLTIDGIYTEPSSIEQMCECAIDLMIKQHH